MFSVEMSSDLLEKFRNMLAEEDDGTCVRLREYRIGGG